VSEVSFTTVCEALDRERSASDSAVLVLMAPVPEGAIEIIIAR
jgi:hypothetical protein